MYDPRLDRTTSPYRTRAVGRIGRPFRAHTSLVPVIVLSIAAVLVGVVALISNTPDPAPPREVPPVNVVVTRIQTVKSVSDTLDLTAAVEPNRVVRVAAEVAGRIESYGKRGHERIWRERRVSTGDSLQEGDPVTRGEPIVYLNKDLLKARVDRAEAQHRDDEREHRRILGLFERNASSETELADAQTQRELSKAALEEIRKMLERATVVAPISGILDRLPKEIGEYAEPGESVAEIVDIERAKVVVLVPERDVHYLRIGDTADVFVRGPPETKLTGKISYISELADAETRTTRMEIGVDNRGQGLRSGQIVRVRLTRRVLTNVVMIPLAAVIPLERGKVVYVVDEGQARRHDVELGLIKGRQVQVRRGLEDGDLLIVSGHRYVGPGQPVAVVEEPSVR